MRGIAHMPPYIDPKKATRVTRVGSIDRFIRAGGAVGGTGVCCGNEVTGGEGWAGVAIVVIGGDRIQFHCMDEAAQIASTPPPVPPPSPPGSIGQQRIRVPNVYFRKIGIGAFVGCLIAVAVVWAPYDRVVVYDQPMSQSVRLSSVRLQRGGFVELQVKRGGGWSRTGESYYLPAGYYRNLVITVDPAPQVEDQVRTEYIVRLYRDSGDHLFDAAQDPPVKDILGRIYSKRFAMHYAHQRYWIIERMFLDHPIRFIVEALF